MLAFIHYISAHQRLRESAKTIRLLGGEEDCNDMLLAQHEMIKLEKEYYAEQSVKTLCFLVITVLCVVGYLFII
jgi:hypothetical protein